METTGLLVNLSIALVAAAIGAAASVRLGQSPVVGYIVAGIVIGPFTPGFVGDVDVVDSLADIGVIFLMFAIGGQISLRDLREVGRVAIAGGTLQVVLVMAVGTAAGVALGWTLLEAVFFGAVISNSSSTVLTKVLGERGEVDSEHGHIGLGWSTVQDLGTIVLIVVLTAVSGAGVTAGDVGLAIGKAVLFLVIVLPVGSRVVPRLFEFLASFRRREIFILGVVSLALATAYLGSAFGISLALGAFLAGVLVSESDLSHQVVGEALPFRDLFAGLFFVSVGMLVDPRFVLENIGLFVVVIALIVVAKGVIVTGITALFGYPARTSILTGIVLAQSAEFSFILARVGTDVGAVGDTVFSLMLAGAAGSIILAPVLYRAGGPLAARVARMRHRAEPESVLLPEPAPSAGRRTAVICGYGRVGRLIASALERRGLDFVVVELDPRIARDATAAGHTVLRGSADNQVVLEQALATGAAVLVVALPDPVAVRLIVTHARALQPRLPIVARTHSLAERAALRRLGATAVVVGEVELALEMTRFTMRQFGVGGREVDVLITGLRGR